MVVVALLIGLFGSMHCVGMCGPIALSIPKRINAPMWEFLSQRLIYNMGRVCTYTILGVAFGFLGGIFYMGGIQQGISICVGISILLWISIPRRFLHRLVRISFLSKHYLRLRSRILPLFQSHSFSSSFVLGMVNGFLPCGFVYIGLAGAITQPSVFHGALFMAMFGLGTIPSMMAVSIAPAVFSVRTLAFLRPLLPVGTAVVAVLLILRGLSLDIPFVSPVLNGEMSNHCVSIQSSDTLTCRQYKQELKP